uniref:Uncharacterized protein n=1 Tax=Chenopodium quinoa TaxID=63459 RepID=A0A803N124_CHEQI
MIFRRGVHRRKKPSEKEDEFVVKATSLSESADGDEAPKAISQTLELGILVGFGIFLISTSICTISRGPGRISLDWTTRISLVLGVARRERFVGSSQSGIDSLGNRLSSLERALDENSHDLAVQSGRIANNDSAGSLCCPSTEFLSPKFWRRTEGRSSSIPKSSYSGMSKALAKLPREEEIAVPEALIQLPLLLVLIQWFEEHRLQAYQNFTSCRHIKDLEAVLHEVRSSTNTKEESHQMQFDAPSTTTNDMNNNDQLELKAMVDVIATKAHEMALAKENDELRAKI